MTSPIVGVEVRCPRCQHDFETYWRASLNRDHFPEMSDAEFHRYVRECNTEGCPECGFKFAIGPALVVEQTEDVEEWRFGA